LRASIDCRMLTAK
jgi:hypothetical protein